MKSLMGWLAMAVLVLACGDDDAVDSGMDATPDSTLDTGVDAGDGGGDASDVGLDAGDGGGRCELPEPAPVLCAPAATDYAPAADDMWPACVSDEGEYVRIQDSISSIQRVLAFEEIASLLFDPESDPSADDFIAARMIYQEEEGLDSRLVRRYDALIDVPDGTDCTLDGVPEMFPEYCVGPATLQPAILDAFADGAMGGGRVAAARVEAVLLWFLYVSTNKEAFTCTTAAKDCDSSYAYYTGGEAARGGVGLARYVEIADPAAHDRVWDALLGLRCWRDLDDEATATMLEFRDWARAQLDRSVSHGFAAVVRSRIEALCTSEGEVADYHWAFLNTLAPALYRAASAVDPTGALTIRTELSRASAAEADLDAVAGAIDTAFPCP